MSHPVCCRLVPQPIASQIIQTASPENARAGVRQMGSSKQKIKALNPLNALLEYLKLSTITQEAFFRVCTKIHSTNYYFD